MTHTHAKVKVKGQSVRKMSGNGRTEAIALPLVLTRSVKLYTLRSRLCC